MMAKAFVSRKRPARWDCANLLIAEPVELWEHPPNGQGLVALITMGILTELEKTGQIKKWTKEDHNSIE